MTNKDKFWKKVGASAVGSILAFVITEGSADGEDLSDLSAGECIFADVGVYPPTNVEVTDCATANTINNYQVVFTQHVLGDHYPGNLNMIARQCAAQGGHLVRPPSQAWRSGAPVALCYRA